MSVEFAAGISALTSFIKLVQAGAATKRGFDIASASSEMLGRLIEIQTAHLTLIQDNGTLADEKRKLEKRVLELESQFQEMAHYERFTLPSGAHVFIDNRNAPRPEAPVYFCATCMEDRKITTLQFDHDGYVLRCPRGHDEIDTGKDAPPPLEHKSLGTF